MRNNQMILVMNQISQHNLWVKQTKNSGNIYQNVTEIVIVLTIFEPLYE